VLLARLSILTFFILCFFDAPGQSQDEQAGILYESGMRYKAAYKFDSAVLMLTKARGMFTPGSVGELDACNMLGDTYKYDLHDFDKAEENFERALLIQQQIGSDTRNLTRLYYNLATTNRSQYDYETAVIWCMKAIDGCKTMSDNVFLERAYAIAGNIYRDMHVFDSAVSYYERGVMVNQSINKGKQNETLAGLYAGWANASYQIGDFKDAVDKYSTAVKIYQRLGTSDRLIYRNTLRLFGEVLVKKGDLDEAEKALQMAEETTLELKLQRGGPVSNLCQTWAEYWIARGDNISAYNYYQRALQAATTEPLGRDGNPKDPDKIDFKAYAYDALLGKASLLADNDALECFKVAEKIMVASRGELDTDEAKWSYVDANYKLYESILCVLYKSSKRDTASIFYFMESSKSKSLADALQEAELKKQFTHDTLFSSLRDLKQNSLLLRHQNDPTARDQLLVNSKRIAAIEQVINSKYPSYLETKVDLSLLQQRLRSLDAAFVEYFWGEENVYALVISPKDLSFYQLKKPDVSVYLELLNARTNQYSREAVSRFVQLSHELYVNLLSPFREQLSGSRLIFVPDGPLMQLPFETLVTSDQQTSFNFLPYLINDYIISYNFSASHLLASQKSPKSKPSLLAFGFTGGAAQRDAETNVEIVGSETELITLSGKFPEGTFLFGDVVTEQNFKDKAADFDLLHLAVHGSGDTGKDYSATLYFRDKEGPEDGKLYWYELYNMNLSASLAVLSSCESGIGKTYRGEGMLSMANAFTFAGCSNIVMGLWKVDDQVSVKLMDTFYTELLNGMAIDEALAVAKRTYLASADQISANPKLWGSLVAYGESPILRADEIQTSWVVAALIVLGAAITVLVIKTRKK
jgi:CHAT domain-containing protein